ncbi:MAG: hypothetical protein R6T90_09220, partial [Dissulfuribacterales bacterium]
TRPTQKTDQPSGRGALAERRFVGKGFNLFRVGDEGFLAGEDLFDAIGQILPLVLGQGEIHSEVEEHLLSGAPFSSHGPDELEGMVFPFCFSIRVGGFSNDHGRIIHGEVACQ